jgi:hypothetical protein
LPINIVGFKETDSGYLSHSMHSSYKTASSGQQRSENNSFSHGEPRPLLHEHKRPAARTYHHVYRKSATEQTGEKSDPANVNSGEHKTSASEYAKPYKQTDGKPRERKRSASGHAHPRECKPFGSDCDKSREKLLPRSVNPNRGQRKMSATECVSSLEHKHSGSENADLREHTASGSDSAQGVPDEKKGNRKRSRRRQTSNKKLEAEGMSFQIKQPVNVYVRIHEVIHDMKRLADVLTRKVNTPGVQLTPTETCIQHSDMFTFCTMTCPDKKMAKKLQSLLLKDKENFSPRIDCR